jgi:hypothetical protein
MGYCYKSAFGWSEWSVYEQKIHIKIVVDPFLVTIDNAKKEKFQLKQIETHFRGKDTASDHLFTATRYFALDMYNDALFIIIYRYDNGKYSVQLEYHASRCYYTNEF